MTTILVWRDARLDFDLPTRSKSETSYGRDSTIREFTTTSGGPSAYTEITQMGFVVCSLTMPGLINLTVVLPSRVPAMDVVRF